MDAGDLELSRVRADAVGVLGRVGYESGADENASALHEGEATRNVDAKQAVDLGALKHIASEAWQRTNKELCERTRRARSDDDACIRDALVTKGQSPTNGGLGFADHGQSKVLSEHDGRG